MAHTDDQILFVHLVLKAWLHAELRVQVDEEKMEIFLSQVRDWDDRSNDNWPEMEVTQGLRIRYIPEYKGGFFLFHALEDGQQGQRHHLADELYHLIRHNPVMVGTPYCTWGQ